METLQLNNGISIPQMGLGVCQASDTTQSVKWAIDAGYLHIDTASIYGNEKQVGEGAPLLQNQ